MVEDGIREPIPICPDLDSRQGVGCFPQFGPEPGVVFVSPADSKDRERGGEEPTLPQSEHGRYEFTGSQIAGRSERKDREWLVDPYRRQPHSAESSLEDVTGQFVFVQFGRHGMTLIPDDNWEPKDFS